MTEYRGRAAFVKVRTATFGKELDGAGQALYRYSLYREWGTGQGLVNFLMLNPSTADHQLDDPTIRRCLAFAMDWGYRSLTVTNLFALRSTSPAGLWAAADPVGPENDRMIRQVAEVAGRIVCAWGIHGAYRDRGLHVLRLLETIGRDTVHCFGKTKDGGPKHPLYLPGRSRLERWWP